MKKIFLKTGEEVLVSDSDFKKISQTNWYLSKNGYASNPRHKSIYMHRAILGLSRGDKFGVDHKNGQKLDNRRSNLRLSNCSLNGANRKNSINNKCGFKGVHFFKLKNKFKAQIRVLGKRKFLGHFDDPAKAAKAYDIAAKKYFGKFAKLNFGGK